MSKPKLTNNKKLKSLRERNAKLVNKTVDTSRSFAEKALEYNRDIVTGQMEAELALTTLVTGLTLAR